MCRYIKVRYWGIRLQWRSRRTVVGQRIAEHADDLTVFADYLGVKSLESFLGQGSVSRKGARQGRPCPEPQWHSAAEGLRSVRSLLSYLSWYPCTDGYYKGVRMELIRFERVLERAERRGLRWRLVAWSERRYFCRGGRPSRDSRPVRIVAAAR
jgi:hypothetical protein